MKVTLISYTPDALELLLLTKNTRLKVSPTLMDEIKAWSDDEKMIQLEYMRHTIQSSWEFVDYVFLIEGVSRAFTHQLVRHRHNSYAQQAQRAVDMTGFEYITGPSISEDQLMNDSYASMMDEISKNYQDLVTLGAHKQDARGVLPTNISTNIIMKANLRSLHDMALKRLCVKAQGEAQDVFREMVAAVKEVHPYFSGFLKVWCATYGTCCFHTFPVSQCPVKARVYNPETQLSYGDDRPARLDVIEAVHNQWRAEAQP